MSSNTTLPLRYGGAPSLRETGRAWALEDLTTLELEEASTYARRLQVVHRLRQAAEEEYRRANTGSRAPRAGGVGGVGSGSGSGSGVDVDVDVDVDSDGDVAGSAGADVQFPWGADGHAESARGADLGADFGADFARRDAAGVPFDERAGEPVGEPVDDPADDDLGSPFGDADDERVSRAEADRLVIPDSVYADVVSEICAVRNVGRRQVEAELAEAYRLIEHLPGVFEEMMEGIIGQRHARAIADEVAPLVEAEVAARQAFECARRLEGDDRPTPEVMRQLQEAAVVAAANLIEYEDQAIDLVEGRTAGSLRDRCHRLVARLIGRTAEERKRAARATRRVWMRDLGDGMSELTAVLASEIAAGINDRLTEQSALIVGARRDAAGVEPGTAGADANTVAADECAGVGDASVAGDRPAFRRPGTATASDERTFEQVRADVFADLLLTSEPSEIHASGRGVDATVAITVPALTLLGVDAEPATMNGATPIAMDDALRYAADAPSWLRILTDPVTGVAREAASYRPTAAQRALIGARDATCRFPGCRRAARRCDIDHAEAWAEGGATALENLECLCQWHHTLKHTTAWSVRHDPERFGDLIWTAPSGREYCQQAPPVGPVFTPSDLKRLSGGKARDTPRDARGGPSGARRSELPPGAGPPPALGSPDAEPPPF